MNNANPLRSCLTGALGALLVGVSANAQTRLPDTVLFGAAYYEEYAPEDRLTKDIEMMRSAGINVVRIAESTWGTLETQPGKFDFTHVDRVLGAMQKAGIKVIVGTPTYAIPTWLAHDHPEVLVTTPNGRASYGARQNMDISDPAFREAAQRVIVALVDHVRDYPTVIGYQVDNETKSYDTSGAGVQAGFVAWMRSRFPDLNQLNKEFGLDYWSNRINRWEDFPSVNGSVNASMKCAFAEYQRKLVTDYLVWQASLVRSHARPDQFVTHNFDLEFQTYSYGFQTAVNQFDAAHALDIAGIDIYHPTQSALTGTEIAFGGDMARSLKGGKNYLVIETEAQGFPQWVPYPGQLRLQAYSHVASGANMVEYWHWGTTSNSIETYWRGLLGQDFQPNPTYQEARTIGAELGRLGHQLVNMKKHNRIAIYVSNRAQTAFNQFPFEWGSKVTYNDVLRALYDALYRQNAEVDFIDPSTRDLSAYKLIVVPALYAAADDELLRLNQWAKSGGHLFYTFKSGFSDENVKVRYSMQPALISEAAGVQYNQFTLPDGVSVASTSNEVGAKASEVRWWMELLTPTTAQILARYNHPVWGKYAAFTRNKWGSGEVYYLGYMPSNEAIENLMADCLKQAGLWGPEQSAHFPLIVRSGELNNGHAVHYLMNYSSSAAAIRYGSGDGIDLLSGAHIARSQDVQLGPWGVAIVEERTALH